MLSMSDINHIRDLHQSGYKISEIHQKTGADPKTIRKYLEKEDFSDSPATAQPKSSILDPFNQRSDSGLRRTVNTGANNIIQHDGSTIDWLRSKVMPAVMRLSSAF